MERYLVTGAAGFIASVVSQKLLDSGAEVVGIDNLNDAYDVRMKEYRLGKLKENPGFSFLQLDVSDRSYWMMTAKRAGLFSCNQPGSPGRCEGQSQGSLGLSGNEYHWNFKPAGIL